MNDQYQFFLTLESKKKNITVLMLMFKKPNQIKHEKRKTNARLASFNGIEYNLVLNK